MNLQFYKVPFAVTVITYIIWPMSFWSETGFGNTSNHDFKIWILATFQFVMQFNKKKTFFFIFGFVYVLFNYLTLVWGYTFSVLTSWSSICRFNLYSCNIYDHGGHKSQIVYYTLYLLINITTTNGVSKFFQKAVGYKKQKLYILKRNINLFNSFITFTFSN